LGGCAVGVRCWLHLGLWWLVALRGTLCVGLRRCLVRLLRGFTGGCAALGGATCSSAVGGGASLSWRAVA